MSGDKPRVAVVGLGVGERHIEGYELNQKSLVTHLCEIEPKKIEDLKRRYPDKRVTSDFSSIVEDESIEIVSIATPDHLHCDQVVESLKAQKHVFVEKPLCLTKAELVRICRQLRKDPSRVISTNLILRKTPRFIDLKNRIQSDGLGQIYYMEGDYDYGRLAKLLKGWRGSIPNYSVMHGGGIHLIDLLTWLTGKKVRSVFGTGNKIMSQEGDFKNNDFSVAILTFEDDAIAKVTSNYGSVTAHHHKLCIYGSKGTYEQSHIGAAYFFDRDPVFSPEMENSQYPGARKSDMIPAFLDAVLTGSNPAVTVQEMVNVMAVSLAVEQSISDGRPVDVEYEDLEFREEI